MRLKHLKLGKLLLLPVVTFNWYLKTEKSKKDSVNHCQFLNNLDLLTVTDNDNRVFPILVLKLDEFI